MAVIAGCAVAVVTLILYACLIAGAEADMAASRRAWKDLDDLVKSLKEDAHESDSDRL